MRIDSCTLVRAPLFARNDMTGRKPTARILAGFDAAGIILTMKPGSIALTLERAGTDGRLDRWSRLLPRTIDKFDGFRNTSDRAGWCRPRWCRPG